MNNKLLYLMSSLFPFDNHNITFEDLKYLDNEKVNKVLLETYFDIMDYCINENHGNLDIFYNNFTSRISILNKKEQKYVYDDLYDLFKCKERQKLLNKER